MASEISVHVRRLINTVCKDGLFVANIHRLSDNEVRVDLAVFSPSLGFKGYIRVTSDGEYKNPDNTPITLDEIISEWSESFPIAYRELYNIDKINGYFNLLEYYLENLDLIMDMDCVFCGFSISYDHAYLRVFDDKRKTSFILKVTDITDDFFRKYDEHYYAMINQEHQEDIKNF